ncbi:MAG: family 78 glycoside hydrolase catalytic domain [Puia sp.]|nr:family 78 glycoside hydrolase catalytic domain [Puia sp.]
MRIFLLFFLSPFFASGRTGLHPAVQKTSTLLVFGKTDPSINPATTVSPVNPAQRKAISIGPHGSGRLSPSVTGWAIEQIKCEDRTDPLGMDEGSPHFSWTFRSDKRNQYQSACEILVADSRSLLQQDKGNIWTLTKTSSAVSVGVEYAGRLLRPFTRYYWKVRAWNRRGIPTPWSATGFFETGSLHTAWQGSWISDGKPQPAKDEDFYKEIPAPMLRKEFSVRKKIAEARLYISGLGYYEAYLNGKKLGDQVLDPGWTNYGKTILYSVYDISVAVKQGRNAFGVMLGNGWYNPLPMKLFGRFNLREVLTTGRPRVLVNLRIRYTDGTTEVVASDTSWRAGEGYIRKNNVYLGEEQDGRLRDDSWAIPYFHDTGWIPASAEDAPGGLLTAQEAPPIRITRLLRPVNVTEPDKKVYVFDLGQNFAGWIRMKIRAGRGQVVHFRYGELLFPSGRVNGMTTVAGHIKDIWHLRGGPGAPLTAYQEDAYVCRGDSTDFFQPHFTFHAFRYVEITGLSEKPALGSLQGLRLNADLPVNGSFTCGNELLNRIQQNTLFTFLSNVFSVQSDCPGREKQGYGADMVVSAEAFIYNFDMSRFYAKTVSDFAADVRPNGGMPECAPYNGITTEGFEEGAGPAGWELAFPFLQERLYRFYGNRKIIADHYQATRDLVEFLRGQARDGLLDHDIGDHVAVNAKHVPLTSGAFYYHHVKLLEEFAGILHKTDDSVLYHKLADSIAVSFNRRYLRKGTGTYDTSYNQTTQVFPLWYGLTPPDEREKAFGALTEDILGRSRGHLTTGIFGTKMLFDVLRRYDRNDIAWMINTQDGYPGYGYMIKKGATTLWETWEEPDQASWNHPMFGSVSEWFYRSLLGINPAEDAVGMDKVELKPYIPGGLRFAKGYYQSVRGRISSEWEKKGGVLYWRIVIPPNTSARIFVPCGQGDTLFESGRPVPDAGGEGFLFAGRASGFSIFEAGSGSYHFTVYPVLRRAR